MITQVLELVLLSHLYHSCALKSVRKAFYDCLSVWLTKNRQSFHNKALMEDLVMPPPKAMALSPTSVKAGLLLKSLEMDLRRSLLAEDLPKEEQHLCITVQQLAGARSTTTPIPPRKGAVSLYMPLYCKWEN